MCKFEQLRATVLNIAQNQQFLAICYSKVFNQEMSLNKPLLMIGQERMGSTQNLNPLGLLERVTSTKNIGVFKPRFYQRTKAEVCFISHTSQGHPAVADLGLNGNYSTITGIVLFHIQGLSQIQHSFAGTLKSFIKTVQCTTNSDTQRSRRGPGILLPVVSREKNQKNKMANGHVVDPAVLQNQVEKTPIVDLFHISNMVRN